ncbi:unnamed protein product [Schistosoma turkestanicum]|nr:unnamed protein product [Schistosoma turkestanicum]
MTDIKQTDELIHEHFKETTTHTTTFEGDQIDSVEDYIVDNTEMEDTQQSSPLINHNIDEDAQIVEDDVDELEDYEQHDYAFQSSGSIKNDKEVFQEKMKDILQEMKMKEIIRDKTSGNTMKQSNANTMNNRPVTPESIDQTLFDHSSDHSSVKDEELAEEELQVKEEINEAHNLDMRLNDRESSVQYEFEPELENDNKSIETKTEMKNEQFQYEEVLPENITSRLENSNSQSRLIYNEVPAMNSQANDIVNFVQEQVETLKLTDESQNNVQYSQQTKHSPVPAFYNKTLLNDTGRTLPVSSTSPTLTIIQKNSSNSRSRPIRPIYQSSVTLSNHNQTTSHSNLNSTMHYPVRRAYSPREEPMSPTRNTIHIGSQVISEQSGPSFTIFLRRPNSERHWGFSFYGGAEYGCPPFVNKVTSNGLANQAGLEVGDVIVSICNSLTVGKTYEQVKAEILRAGNELDLILIRRGVDLNKVAQIAPHIMTTSSFVHQSSIDSDNSSQRKLSTRSLTRGRSFRPIQTKSFRILEQQLSISESTGNPIVKPKQITHEPRIINSPSYSTTFTKPYGQNMNNQGFITDIQIKPTQMHHVTTSTTIIHPKSNQNNNNNNNNNNIQTQFNSYDYGRAVSHVSPNQWVTTQPIQISGVMNTNNTNNIGRQSYQRSENVAWIKVSPSHQCSQNDLYNQSNYYITNSYTEHRDSSSTRSVPIYPMSYSPYRQQL